MKEASMSAYEKVIAARAKGRATASDFIKNIFTDFTELHGDRLFGDDKAVITGIGYLDGMPVTVIATEKGKDFKSKARNNFGSAHPEGYR